MATPSFSSMGVLAQLQLDSTVQTVYTVPYNQAVIISRQIIADVSGSGDTVKEWIDGSANGNEIQPPIAIAPYGRDSDCCSFPLNTGQSIKAQSVAANRLTFTLFGIVYNLS